MSGVIFGGGLVKEGTGVLTLSGANAFLASGDQATLSGDASGRAVLHGLAGLTLDLTDNVELSGDVPLAGGDEERSAFSIGARWRF